MIPNPAAPHRLMRAGFAVFCAALLALLPVLSSVQAAELAKPRMAAEQVLHTTMSEPDSIDPQKASFTEEIDKIMMVFSNLYTWDSGGNIVPDQAAALPEIASDGKTITVKLRSGLKYSDGVPLTAKNFQYGWLRHLDPRVASEYAFTGYDIVGAEAYNTSTATDAATLDRLRAAVGVTSPDDLTLVFNLDKPAVYFVSVLTTWNGVPTREDMVTKGGASWTEPATYIGNGPFKLTIWEHQVRMVFEANTNYWRGAPKIQRWEKVVINDATVAFTAYRNGELDISGVGPSQLDIVKGDRQLSSEYTSAPGHCTYYLGFNNTKAPFDKLAVRQAFAYAFDRDTWVKDVNRGLGLPATQFLPPGFPGYYPDLKSYSFDGAKAKQILTDAGITPESLGEISYSYGSNPTSQLRAEWIQNQMQTVLGVKIKLDPIEPRAYSAQLKRLETVPPMFFLGWCQDYPDPQNWYSTVFSSSATVSRTGWKNPEFDRLTRQADGEPNQARRDTLYKQAAQILIDEAPVAFVSYSVDSYLVKPWVKNWSSTPFDYYFGLTTIMDMYIADE